MSDMVEHYYGHAEQFALPTTHQFYHIVIEAGQCRDYFTTHGGEIVDGKELADAKEMRPQIDSMIANGSLQLFGVPLGPIPVNPMYRTAMVGLALGMTPDEIDMLTEALHHP